jgi:hypothetical protein
MMVLYIVIGLLVLLLIAGLFVALPDILRYLRIRSM